MKKVLFCPLHYINSDKHGSEISRAYNIGKNEKVIGTKVVGYNEVKGSNSINLMDENKGFRNNYLFVILFAIKYSIYGLFNYKRYDIYHHVLPRANGLTFNLGIIINRGKIKSVIGPIQSPIQINKDDVIKNNINHKIKKIILTIIKKINFQLSQLTLFYATKIIAVSNYSKNELIKLGVEEDKIKVIPPGINKEFFANDIKHPGEITKFIISGWLIKRKGIDIIIKSINYIVNKGYTSIEVNIVGDGVEKNNLMKMVNELNLNKYINFIGKFESSEMPIIYKKHDILLSMSNSESFGMMYVEAMASGLCIISSKNEGSNEIIKNGINGIIVNIGDYEGMGDSIVELINNKIKLLEYKKIALNEAKEKYNRNNIIEKYNEIYSEILKK